MQNVTRRSFVSCAAAGVTALGMFSGLSHEADAQLVWKTEDWKLAEFQKLVKDPARIKQVYDVTQIADGKFLNNVKNSLNGLRFGFGVPEQQIKVAAALHGPTNMMNYDDYVWEKYQIGAWLKVTDPATDKPAVRNIFYKSTLPATAASISDPNDRNSSFQDTAIETLQARGVQFLSCHTATEEQARALVKHNNLTQQPEEIVHDMLAHTVPGVLVVASMVAAVALLQAEGHYTYITL
jgi:intracellular sulfur oxidation DsrE/DsrF family protein